ncbi:hypothetical protein Q8791_23025 [Nocardiopsis sp. CT-R113]|uniref:Uncharacterized protein n=1 Tax=Nocardiopsis codii TaxID=3065942 RepID=A0ABU7KDV8_9ACTN|nr:hypothetical protein [Nocardiopsis sp. CT-R113]MEE2040094.1 hypothetical protein [Nocardiopsis sp. CT-R113]
MTRRRPAASQMTIGHADPSYEEVRRTVLAQVVEAWEELEEARRWAQYDRRDYGAKDRLARARVRWAIVTDQPPDPVELAMGYRHGWIEDLLHRAPPNPARAAPSPINPTIARAMQYLEDAEGATS